MNRIAESELILNERGAIYHINLTPDELADTVITVGDPDRVAVVSKEFDSIEVKRQHREFIAHTGYVGKKRITVISTGIGPDNIDIVVNELDALKNIDLDNLIDGEPYDRIEDILVPIYMLHRYQIEAAAKAIGGVDYLYFVKNKSNDKVKFVDSKLQSESLESLLNVLKPSNLVLPNNLIDILSPRSFRNPRTRENFASNTGVAFDFINASSSLINHTLTFLLNPERINRINQQNMFGENILKLENYLLKISNSIFSNKKMNVYENSISKNTSSLYLDHLFMAFNSTKTNDISKSLILASIMDTMKKLLKDY